ncbi:putative serine dehydratase domain-containing protein [Triangularia verruculosa]|uniref:D-serine dehydratase n=1 Tax=Triangularia verruculosa TaxID=2587418 RepID=A0AAN6X7H0_9PEZI|nr:putative serine dehydratase domain-containing protein [Triangularia verruculosa]
MPPISLNTSNNQATMASPTSDAALKEQLKGRFVGKTLNEVPTPSVILDLAKLETNCNGMLEATEKLGLLWRAHIKTHKTTELTRLQVGNDMSRPVNIVVSTIIEAENILPLLKEYQSKGIKVNVLFSFPLFPSAVSRLADLSAQLGPDSISLMVDHPKQLESASAIAHTTGAYPPLVFIKIDGGYHRAGVEPSPTFINPDAAIQGGTRHPSEMLIDAVLAAEKENKCVLHGVYIHAGHSYGTRTDWAALGYLTEEFRICLDFAEAIRKRSPGHKLVMSVGATPTATAIQHPDIVSSSERNGDGSVKKLREFITKWATGDNAYQLEVHAGVYSTLDLQQLATHARDSSLLKAEDIAISVLAEVASLYPSRGKNSTTEALINAGCLALGREPVTDMGNVPGADYSGWGFAMPWGGKLTSNPVPGHDFPRVHPGWQVGKISQEHGILVWHGEPEEEIPLEYGQRVRVWPNHSCIAGACFDWYLIVDSRNTGREDEVVDVWPRWRGW